MPAADPVFKLARRKRLTPQERAHVMLSTGVVHTNGMNMLQYIMAHSPVCDEALLDDMLAAGYSTNSFSTLRDIQSIFTSPPTCLWTPIKRAKFEWLLKHQCPFLANNANKHDFTGFIFELAMYHCGETGGCWPRPACTDFVLFIKQLLAKDMIERDLRQFSLCFPHFHSRDLEGLKWFDVTFIVDWRQLDERSLCWWLQATNDHNALAWLIQKHPPALQAAVDSYYYGFLSLCMSAKYANSSFVKRIYDECVVPHDTDVEAWKGFVRDYRRGQNTEMDAIYQYGIDTHKIDTAAHK